MFNTKLISETLPAVPKVITCPVLTTGVPSTTTVFWLLSRSVTFKPCMLAPVEIVEIALYTPTTVPTESSSAFAKVIVPLLLFALTVLLTSLTIKVAMFSEVSDISSIEKTKPELFLINSEPAPINVSVVPSFIVPPGAPLKVKDVPLIAETVTSLLMQFQ